MTLLAVGVLGGALFVANTVGTNDSTATAQNTAASAPADPAAAPPQAAPAAPAEEQPGEQVDLADVPVAGAEDAPDEDAPDEAAPDEAAPAAPDGDDAGENAPLDDNVYAGRTDDGDLTVAIAINDGEAEAYVCGDGLEVWLSGSATAAGLDLTSESGRSTLTGALDGETITGTFTTDGDESDYTADETTVAEARADGRPDVGRVAERAGL